MKIHEKFKPLFEGKTRYYIITGGRNSSKSFTVSTFLNLLTFKPFHRILFTRYTMISAQVSIIPEFLEKIEMLGYSALFDITKTEIIHKYSRSDILFRGIKTSQGIQTANLKSLTGVSVWVLDEAEELPDEGTFDKIDLSVRSMRQKNMIIIILNPVHKEHWIYKRFFERYNIPDGYNGVLGNTTYIHTTYLDNLDNIPKDYLDRVEEMKRTNPEKYRHQILGSWVTDVEGALWDYDLIQRNRVEKHPELSRIIVAIDPAVTSTPDSDETGIIVAGKGNDGKCYILEDVSGILTPRQWAERAVYAYEKWDADRIVAEKNNGGDLVEVNLQTVDAGLKPKLVHASRGKVTRAEPVVNLYEQDRVKHVGILPKLETQQITWAAKQGDKSPDRIDALVWGVSELMLESEPSMYIK